jgi:ribosomal protein S12
MKKERIMTEKGLCTKNMTTTAKAIPNTANRRLALDHAVALPFS